MTTRIAAALLASLLGAAAPAPPPVLARGINVTGWFRYPGSTAPAALAGYLSDAALANLRGAGFTFVRLPVQPALLDNPALIVAIARIQRAGLAVDVALDPPGWHLESSAADRAALLAAWTRGASALARLDPRLTFPEVLNEPVFPNDAAGWAALQERVRAVIRARLPRATIVLTGSDWGSAAGLLALPPSTDPNVIYSIHFYDPSELTSLAAYRAGLDRGALARLPFPMTGRDCPASADAATDALLAYVCAQGWDAARVAARIGQAAAWGEAHQAAILLGEFGASRALNAPARLAWLASVRIAAERAGIGWALWGYDDIMGLGVARPPPPRPPLDPAVLQALGLHTGL